MSSYVEHANITVNNLHSTIHFLQSAMPDFKVRGEGRNQHYGWCHLGTETSYIALQEVVIDKAVERIPYRQLGTNHIGFVVDDVTSVSERLKAEGFTQIEFNESHPSRKRAYFLDADGIEWEFVEYLTDAMESRNDYTL
ncbi:VOC family protein [Enterovibrio coralii]|uniref:Lactoylglutathione lyase n=1 Tax=Enterovibrio coralii TaxID=294935 RepID=A0A135I2G4_9GAMM|nr:VOC family protein [Enterovibrio coralii]KXF79625.1 lactoylglutathione lyase [Enterovibrio coralii]